VAVMKPESGNWFNPDTPARPGIVTVVCWSPDGSLLYYDRMTGVPNGVFSVPVLGGEEHGPRKLPNGITPAPPAPSRKWCAMPCLKSLC